MTFAHLEMHSTLACVSSQARNSLHAPSNADEEDELLIYNFEPKFTGKHTYEGEEVRWCPVHGQDCPRHRKMPEAYLQRSTCQYDGRILCDVEQLWF